VRLAVIVDKDETISKWQFDALNNALLDKHKIELILVSKGKTLSPSKSLKKIFYYILAIVSRYGLKNLSRVSITELKIGFNKKIYFDSKLSGNWESLPDNVIDELSKVDLIIKFGMGLLGETEKIPTRYGVFSYHHGDPSRYRGRPAGFWESFRSENIMGVMVQQLSNSLDAGVIRAIGFSKVSKTSYKKTMKNMYATGIPLLRKALNNCENGITISYDKSSEVFTLPANKIVVKFLFNQVLQFLQRIKYGAFIQKSWAVAKTEFFGNFEAEILIKKNQISLVPKPEGFTFVADPAGKLKNLIYCELLDSKTGLGEIGIWNSQTWKLLKTGVSGHKSYPQIVSHGGKNYLFPEISETGSPTLFELDESGQEIISNFHLKGLEKTRQVDATLFCFEGYWYLFSGNNLDSEQRLNLYISRDLFADFSPHPKSPIVLDPRNSRMAGPIQIYESKIYRFSQDCSDRYGSKIQVNKINGLSPHEYSEVRVGSIEIEKAFGPHTLLKVGQEIWIDFYDEIFDFTAGYRRLMAKFRKFY
jgi:hypothetical protein